MKYICPLLVVDDIQKSREFYGKVFGLTVVSDFGANICFNCGLALQTKDSYASFIEKEEKDIKYCGNDAEMYFEEEDIDAFCENISNLDIDYVHKLIEHPWGQRVVRIYDLDKHIIEIGENMEVVCRRLYKQGMSIEQISEKTMFPVAFIENTVK